MELTLDERERLQHLYRGGKALGRDEQEIIRTLNDYLREINSEYRVASISDDGLELVKVNG